MTRRRRLRRRLLWAGVLLVLVLLVATVSVLRAALWARDRLVTAATRTSHAPPIRKEHSMHLKTSLVILASVGALLLAVPAFGKADLSPVPQWQQALEARSQGLNEKHGLGSDEAFVRALNLRGEALNQKYGSGNAVTSISPLDRRELAFGKQLAQTATNGGADWFERFAAAHSYRAPVVDDRFRIDPTTIASTPVTVTSGRDLEWPQIGIGLVFGIALALLALAAVRLTRARPLAH